jgi:hypothetical protein
MLFFLTGELQTVNSHGIIAISNRVGACRWLGGGSAPSERFAMNWTAF